MKQMAIPQNLTQANFLPQFEAFLTHYSIPVAPVIETNIFDGSGSDLTTLNFGLPGASVVSVSPLLRLMEYENGSEVVLSSATPADLALAARAPRLSGERMLLQGAIDSAVGMAMEIMEEDGNIRAAGEYIFEHARRMSESENAHYPASLAFIKSGTLLAFVKDQEARVKSMEAFRRASASLEGGMMAAMAREFSADLYAGIETLPGAGQNLGPQVMQDNAAAARLWKGSLETFSNDPAHRPLEYEIARNRGIIRAYIGRDFATLKDFYWEIINTDPETDPLEKIFDRLRWAWAVIHPHDVGGKGWSPIGQVLGSALAIWGDQVSEAYPQSAIEILRAFQESTFMFSRSV